MIETQEVAAAKHTVRVHIDRVQYRSPNPTDGEELYVLGKVKPDFLLYREVEGNEEDPLVPNDKEKVHLFEDEHFYSKHRHKKTFTIIVNGREKEVDHKTVSFNEIVTLSGLPSKPDTIFTVTYKKGRKHAEGTMVEGDTIKIKEGMIFNVTATSKS